MQDVDRTGERCWSRAFVGVRAHCTTLYPGWGSVLTRLF